MSIPPVSSVASAPAPHVNYDLKALQRGNLAPAEQRAAVASQFEAILLRQFLQQSIGALMGGGEGNSGGNVYGYMLTDSLAQKLAEGKGMGLAPIIARQLTPRGQPAAAPTENKSP